MQADPDSYRFGYMAANMDARLAIQKVLRRPSTNDETSAALFDVFKLLEKSMHEMYSKQAPNIFTNGKETQITKH